MDQCWAVLESFDPEPWRRRCPPAWPIRRAILRHLLQHSHSPHWSAAHASAPSQLSTCVLPVFALLVVFRLLGQWQRSARRAPTTTAMPASVKRPRNDYRRDRVLEDELLLIICFQYDGILVKALDAAGQFNPAH